MRKGVINFSSVWIPPVLSDTLGKKSQTWRQGGNRSFKRKACLNSQQGDSLVISYMMLSSLVKKFVDPERSMCCTSPSDRQRALGFRFNPPWGSQLRPEAPHTQCTKSSPDSLTAAQVLTTAGTCRMSLIFQISLQGIVSCGLWCLRKRKLLPESLQVITVTVASIFKSRKKCRRSLLPQPQWARVQAGAVTGMQILPDTSFSSTDSPLFWPSLSITTRGCCYCVSAKGGPAWGQHSSNLTQRKSRAFPDAHRAAVVQPRCLGDTAQAVGGNGSSSNSSKHTENRHTKTSALGSRGSTTASFECVLPLLHSLRSERKRSVEEN